MARHKSAESKIQSDPILVSKVCEEIHTIGPIVLAKYGLVNRTTIHEWTTGKQVTGKSEQAILDSIEKWKLDQDTEAEARREKAIQIVMA